MADRTNFDIGQGETFKILAHIFTENSSSVPLDITNHSFAGQLRENYTTEEIAATLDITKVNPAISGSIFIQLSPTATAALSQRTYVYDVMMTSGSYARRLLEGSFTIRPAVTRA